MFNLDKLKGYWNSLITYPAPSNLNYNYNFGVYAVVNSALLGMLYFSTYFYLCFLYFICILLYLSVYIWRKLPFSLLSYICFIINYSFFSLYIYGLYNIFVIGLDKPIYVEDLSSFSYYRYVTFLVISLLGIIIFLLMKYYPTMSSFITLVSYPYLKEEVRLILTSWENSFFGSLWSNLIDLIVLSHKFRIFFFCIHSLFLSFIPLIQILFFLYSILFHGDLRLVIYLLPLSFLIWLLRFFDYYFISFIEINSNECRQMLSVTCKTMPLGDTIDFYTVSSSDLIFTLTKKGILHAQDAPTEVLFELIPLWKTLAAFHVYIRNYRKFFYYLNILRLFLRLLCWCLLVYFLIPKDTLILTLSYILVHRVTGTNFRPYATQAFRVKKSFQEALEKKAQGAYKGPHPVTTDTDNPINGEIPFMHQPTHGTGPVNNKSKPLHSTEDLKGNLRPQNAVAPEKPIVFPKSWLDKPIPGSLEFYEKNEVRDNMKKHFPEIPKISQED